MSRDPRNEDRERRHLLWAGGIWLVLTVLGEAAIQLLLVDSFPVSAAREGRVADDAILFLLRIVVPVFTFVVVVIVYSMIRFRVADDDDGVSAVQRRGDPWFAWSWVGTTSVLTVLVIFYPGISGLREIWETRDARDPLVVQVTALQWEWRFTYPSQRVVDATELVLPVGRPVRFVLRSEDVIHSFWVPAFRIKSDAIPGETRDLYLTPDRLVSTSTSPLARVQCAELCGIGHAEMRAAVRVVTPATFAAWAQENRMPAEASAG